MVTGSGTSLLTTINIVQNACALGNIAILSGDQHVAYQASSVAWNANCVSMTRKCTNGVLDGDSSYAFDACASATPLNCTATTWSGYTVPAISHLASQTITRTLTGGTGSLLVSCTNGVLTYGNESVSCTTGYVLQGNTCVTDTCPGNAPTYAISNGTQSLVGTWNHNTTP